MKKIVNVSSAPKPLAPYSHAVMANDTLYISGQIGINPQEGTLVEGGVAAQCKQVMENIGAVLNEVGFDYTNIVKCSIFMKDMSFYAEVNEVYGTYFQVDPPAREAVAVKGLPADVDVEISCIAIKK